MQREPTSMRDPVCGMMVHTLDHVVDYKGIHLAFCSEQCKERFLANNRPPSRKERKPLRSGGCILPSR